MLTAIAITLAAQSVADDGLLARMTTLYDQICLKTFPADDAVAVAMAARGAVALTQKEVKTYLNDDPGRGWKIADGAGKFIVTIEAPPYHACSVRRTTPAGFADLALYEAVAGPYERVTGGYDKIQPTDMTIGDIASHVIGEQRTTPDGGGESLYVFSNTPNDPADRAKGYTAVEVRFVHQFAAPGAR